MKRLLFASGSVVLLMVVMVAAQPPAPPVMPPAPLVPPPMFPTPPAALPVTPGTPAPLPTPPAPPQTLPSGMVPGAPTAPPTAGFDTPLSKFVLTLSAYPQHTQDAVRGSVTAANWLANHHEANGQFRNGYLPILRRPMPGESDIRQAQATLAMAQAAKFTGDRKHAAVASQSILRLLALTRPDANDPNCRVPVQLSLVCNRVGFAALTALAVYELPNPGEKLLADAEQLCNFLRTRVKADGAVHYTDGPTDDPVKLDPAGQNEFPGLALQALAASNRTRPAEWKKDAVKRGVAHCHAAFRTKPHPLLAATVVPAAADLYLQTKLPEPLTAAFEMADWLCGLQVQANDPRSPQWAGGFRAVTDGRASEAAPLTADTGRCVQCLSWAYQLSRAAGDVSREAKYRPAVTFAVQFLCGLQFVITNTDHFENSFRVNVLLGAFFVSPADGNIRLDAPACAVTGLLTFLSSGAQVH